MNYTDPDREPLSPTGGRLLRTAVVAVIALVCFATVVGVGGSIALLFISSPPIKSENLLLVTDCLEVAILGRQETIRDAQTIAAVRAWIDSRSDHWGENFLKASVQGERLIVIRACNRPPGTSDTYVYLDEDWIGFNPSKKLQRRISRGEWREMAAIITGARP